MPFPARTTIHHILTICKDNLLNILRLFLFFWAAGVFRLPVSWHTDDIPDIPLSRILSPRSLDFYRHFRWQKIVCKSCPSAAPFFLISSFCCSFIVHLSGSRAHNHWIFTDIFADRKLSVKVVPSRLRFFWFPPPAAPSSSIWQDPAPAIVEFLQTISLTENYL